MAGTKGHSGGTRSNAGRKPSEPIFVFRGEWAGYEIWQGRRFFILRAWSLRQGERTNTETRIAISDVPAKFSGDMAERIANPYDPDYMADRGQVFASYIEIYGEITRKGYEVR